jgi:alkanesulfonate monooxygenase SsuD/methylene tetrahydromethanopterin reductase-like flavin-dependent oxidoreductase (luciferase family)
MRLSIVEVSVVLPLASHHDALRHSIDLAQRAEAWEYERFWVAEHHGAASVASRAPEVLIAAIAARTSTIRVGSGSVLLNHYSALKVAEVFAH